MEIVVTGRNSEISDRFRTHVAEKLQRIEKFDGRQRITRVEVEVNHEKNPRQPDTAARVEMTLRSRGPAVRVEASSTDQHSALDAAVDKLESRLRKVVERKRSHRDKHGPESIEAATADLPVADFEERDEESSEEGVRKVGPLEVQGDGPLVVREKEHTSAAMTLDQAMYEMELVGHDFYLFVEKDSMKPSVVYRRRGYDYGVIRLTVEE